MFSFLGSNHHSLLRKRFIEHLLCAKHYPGDWLFHPGFLTHTWLGSPAVSGQSHRLKGLHCNCEAPGLVSRLAAL